MSKQDKSTIFGLVVSILVLVVILLTNPKPTVIPSLQEWSSGLGTLTLNRYSQIWIDSQYEDQLLPVGLTLHDELIMIKDLDLPVHVGKPGWGDIYLTLAKGDDVIGVEGYEIEIGCKVIIRSETADGVFRGTRTILQILQQASSNGLPRGTIRDYPRWRVRGFMLDVGRMYFPIGELIDYVKHLSWYKMNEFHIHLNDNQPSPTDMNDYSAFRLESDVYPGLAARDGYYTKAEWSELESIADLYGVSILPEIDTPAHALAMTHYRSSLVYSEMEVDKINLASDDTYQFITNLWLEYLPIFSFNTVHIGGDEYVSGASTSFTKYLKYLDDLMIKNNKETRMWGSTNETNGFDSLPPGISLDIYDYYSSDPQEAVAKGFNVVNTIDRYLYIVPQAGYYREYLDTQWLYGEWQPYVFGSKRYDLDPNEPHLLGAKFCVWNDKLGDGYSTEDVYNRVRPAVQTLSEILWNDGSDTSYLEFTRLWQKIGDAPDTRSDNNTRFDDTNNLAIKGFAYSSSIENGTPNIASQAIDGNSDTYWQSDYLDDQWLKIDLLDHYHVSQIRIHWGETYAEEFRLQTSKDGIFWKTISTVTDFQGGLFEISLPKNSVRFVRILADKASSKWGFVVHEIEISIAD
ncbi:MAG: family 20 glycosylhydrolase [Anaerolineaceae bacterium]|nr:family 20 glycosylhydrolase [Anaerolineaceae bacterium]